MKIFNVEKGIKKIYVQLNDIAKLLTLNEDIPISVRRYSSLEINDSNNSQFISFTNPEVLEYFMNIDWIVDFKEYRYLSEEQLMEQAQRTFDEMNMILSEYKEKLFTEKIADNGLISKYRKLDYKSKSIVDILHFKKGIKEIPFPEVADSDGPYLVADDEAIPFVANQGVNPLQIIISLKDGKELKGDDCVIPVMFFQAAEMLIINKNLDTNEFFGEDISVKRKFSTDSMEFISTYEIVPRIEDKKELSVTKKLEKALNKIRDLFSNKK